MSDNRPKAAPTFWFAERGFENSAGPCICMDNPTGGDPLVVAQLQPNEFWPNYVNAMCDAASRCFRMAEELSSRLAALNKIAEGATPPDQHGHYLAHREAVRIARAAVREKPHSVADFSDNEIDLFAQTLFAGFHSDSARVTAREGQARWDNESPLAKGNWRRAARALIRHVYFGQPQSRQPAVPVPADPPADEAA